MLNTTNNTKKSQLNVVFGMINTILVSILSFVVIRLTITYFLDDVNGIVRTATSIISYANLAQGSIGLAIVFLFYAPIAKKDTESINKIMTIANKWLKIMGIIYVLLLLALASLLPVIISDNSRNASFTYQYLFLLTFLIGVPTSFSYFFSYKYQMFAIASNRKFIISILSIVFNVLITGIVLVLMWKIHNATSLLIYLFVLNIKSVLISGCLMIYVKKKNSWLRISKTIDKKFERTFRTKTLNSLVHQVAALIVFSTDEITLAIYSHSVGATKALILISVYSSYMMIANFAQVIGGILIMSFENQMGIENQKGKIGSKKFMEFEIKSIAWVLFIYINLVILLPQYVNLLFNVNHLPQYFSNIIGFLVATTVLLNLIRKPSQIMVDVNGHFKETRWRAIAEATINLTLSLILVWFLGIYGVLIATIISFGYRTIDLTVYSSRFFKEKITHKRLLNFISILLVVLSMLAFSLLSKKIFDMKSLIILTLIIPIVTFLITNIIAKINFKIILTRRQNDICNSSDL